MATRRAGVREVATYIQMQVTRYTPAPDAVPTVANYEVPLRKDWSILDG